MMSGEKIKKIYEECLCIESGPFGKWINSLFGLVAARTDNIPFVEKKEVFFAVLAKLIEDGRVILSTPPCLDDLEPGYYVISDGYSIRKQYRKACRTDAEETNRFWKWDVPIDRQIDYFRSVFPKNVSDSEDAELNLYWYLDKCPRIAWLHPDTGVLYAS
jgi:hypothetical protein